MSKYFFKTQAELKTYVNVSAGLSLESLEPLMIDSPATEQLVKILGADLYNSLLDAYDASNLTEPLEALLPYVQGALAPLAVYHWLQEGGVTISDGGITSNREQQAFQWQQEKLERHYLSQAYFRLDKLLSFLHANKANYEGWNETSAYAESREFFINTPQLFNRWVNINESYRTLQSLRPIMRQVEETKLRPLLTSTLFDAIKAQIQENNVSADNKTLQHYIEPAVAFFTMAQAIDELNMEVSADGVFVYSLRAQSTANVKERTAPGESQLLRAMERYEKKGQQWLADLENYLNANASSTKYTSYFDSDNYPSGDETSPRNIDESLQSWNAIR